MAAKDFDIYEADGSYVAVTNPVRRQILAALEEKELDLTEIARITKRAKPTLSNLHVRELLQQHIVEELAHPTDSRKKLYRIRGRRIGSSNVPIDQLRSAVKSYVSLSPLAYSVPLPLVMRAILAGAAYAPAPALAAQGRALGMGAAQVFSATGPRDLVTAIAGFLEREGVARVGKINLDALEIEVEPADEFRGDKTTLEVTAHVVGGFITGVASARLGAERGVKHRVAPHGRLVFALTA